MITVYMCIQVNRWCNKIVALQFYILKNIEEVPHQLKICSFNCEGFNSSVENVLQLCENNDLLFLQEVMNCRSLIHFIAILMGLVLLQ